MCKQLKIIIINHSFQISYYSRRWLLFAKDHPNMNVTLLAPETHEWYKGKYTFGNTLVVSGKEFDDDNFHVKLFKTQSYPFLGWTSNSFKKIFLEIKPDVIYHIGDHTSLSLITIIYLVKKYLSSTKVIAFSMRGPHHNLKIDNSSKDLYSWLRTRADYIYKKKKLKYINKYCDAFFCHYPEAMQAFRYEGYAGPIYMQTQVGVNSEWFHPDENARKEIRGKYHLGDSYVFGSATRFTKDKGLFDIIKALPKDCDWKFLMMGSGTQEQEDELRTAINQEGLQERIILTGFVDWYDMSKYWNAVDCAIHVPRTTSTWIETFSLSVIQPMAIKKPVIGNTSGSVPYQIGFKEMIVPEGDIEALEHKMKWILSHKEEAEIIGLKMYERTMNSFEIKHLNDLFYRTIVEDVLQGKYDKKKSDMTNYIPKEYEKQE